jgi:hypothetical protein
MLEEYCSIKELKFHKDTCELERIASHITTFKKKGNLKIK